MRVRRSSALLLSCIAALTLGACSGSSQSVLPEPTEAVVPSPTATPCASFDRTVDGVTVQRTDGVAPTVTIAPSAPQAAELVVVDLCEGSGPVVTDADSVTVDYIGVTLATGQPFDSTYGQGAATIPYASLVEGWQQGLAGMRAGGTRLLIIPADLAYGEAAADSGGPSGTLVFVLDLLAIT